MSEIIDQFGICALSVIPLRAEPSDRSEITSQLLFGDSYMVLKTSDDKKWINISNAFDDYSGWIDARQYLPVNASYYDTVKSSCFPICKDLVALVRGRSKIFPIVFGSVLPFYEGGFVMLGDEQFIFEGRIAIPEKVNFKTLEITARYYLSTPYLWGGRTHFGIDCSGFVQQVFKISGYSLPRDSAHQSEAGQEVSFGQMKPGDVAFFKNAHGKIIHVGIVLEHKLIIHASGEVRIDRLDETGIYNEDKNVYTHKLATIRRILQ